MIEEKRKADEEAKWIEERRLADEKRIEQAKIE